MTLHKGIVLYSYSPKKLLYFWNL